MPFMLVSNVNGVIRSTGETYEGRNPPIGATIINEIYPLEVPQGWTNGVLKVANGKRIPATLEEIAADRTQERIDRRLEEKEIRKENLATQKSDIDFVQRVANRILRKIEQGDFTALTDVEIANIWRRAIDDNS